MGGFSELLKSRRFVTGVLSAVVTLVIYFVSKYAFGALEDVQTVINVLMPIALALIAAYTVSDVVAEHERARVEVENLRFMALREQVEIETLKAQAAKQG